MAYSGPAYSGVGTASETAPSWPTHASGDLGLLFVEHPTTTISTPSGWTLLPNMPIDNPASSVRLTIFYRFATSAAEGAPSISHVNHCWGVIVTYTGVDNETPFHGLTVGWRQSALSQAMVGTQPLLDNCMIVTCFAWALDHAGPLSSAETNAQLTNVAERYDGGTITGNGGGVIVIDGELETKTVVKQTAFTLSNSSAGAVATLALQKAGSTLPTLANKSRIVNTGM